MCIFTEPNVKAVWLALFEAVNLSDVDFLQLESWFGGFGLVLLVHVLPIVCDVVLKDFNRLVLLLWLW